MPGSEEIGDDGIGVEKGDGLQLPQQPAFPRGPPRSRNYSWAELMRRVWRIDVLECPACHGRMRILAAIHSPEAIRAILDCLGLPSRAPPVASAALEQDCE